MLNEDVLDPIDIPSFDRPIHKHSPHRLGGLYDSRMTAVVVASASTLLSLRRDGP